MTRSRPLWLLAVLGASLALVAMGLRAEPAGPSPPQPSAPTLHPEAAAPEALVLVADRIELDREAGTVRASGNVEATYAGWVLRAERIVYAEAEDALSIEGPLLLADPELGVLEAEAAVLSTDLREALVRSARLLIAGEMQVAAAEVRRAAGRYTTLHGALASTCEVCPGGGPPTWAIRAERVIRDEEALRIHFRNATLEILGVPVIWLPYLRIPDPTAGRASGLLAPEFRRSDIYGAGFRLPYYQVLGPSADATLTPFLTQRAGTLLEAEFRRRLGRGGFDIRGTLAPEDRLGQRGPRGALFAEGSLALGRGFVLDFDGGWASDRAFLGAFDYSEADRLTSAARLSRTRAQDHFELGTVAFQSLRPGIDPAQVPLVLPEFGYRRLWREGMFGGQLGLELDALGVIRARSGGRDVLRAGASGDWRRDWTLGPGVLAAATAALRIDAYRIRDDPRAEPSVLRLAPALATELRWPLVRQTGAAQHLIEPIAQLAWSDTTASAAPPNEDSLIIEFDETNLFALDRLPGRDRIETGLRANLGIGYTRLAAGGWSMHARLGRVLRFSDRDQFAQGSGLAGSRSDWVGALEIDLGERLRATNRVRFDDAFAIARNDFGLAYSGARAELAASHTFLAAEAAGPELAARPATNEIALDAGYRVLPNWRVRANWRFDAATDTTLRAGGGITYGNECAEIDLSFTRRFTAVGDVPAATSVGFVVRLVGLGSAGTEAWPRRACGEAATPTVDAWRERD